MSELSSNIVLEARGLRKVFNEDLLRPSITAISDIHCRFVSGTINTIIGHNGAGKTTTLRIILGLLRPDEGELIFKGRPMRIHDRRSIGYMPEIHRLSGLLTPQETLTAHLLYYPSPERTYRERKRLVEEYLTKLEVWPHRKKKVRELSKGLQRRLAYCLAVIHQPEFLILDEPFAGLDPLGHEMMEAWLLEEKEKKHTIIMSSHDVDAMSELCDYYHVFSNGKTVYSSLDEQQDGELTPRYELAVTGVEKQVLGEYLKEDPALVPPDQWQSTGYAHRLICPSYEAGRRLLVHLLGKGVLVTSFKSLGLVEKDKILDYFRRDQSANSGSDSDHEPQQVAQDRTEAHSIQKGGVNAGIEADLNKIENQDAPGPEQVPSGN